MQTLNDLALAIDAASDVGDKEALRRLGKECESLLDRATGDERVFLLYFQSNTHSAISAAQSGDSSGIWDW